MRLFDYLASSLLVMLGCGHTPAPPQPSAVSASIEPPAVSAPTGPRRSRVVYVPAYSHLPRTTEAERPLLLSIVLSVRNVDPAATITLTHVDYFDTSGHRVRRYLPAPRPLRPLESADFSVAARDDAGGSGANFLVYWDGPSDAQPIIAESIMLSHQLGGYVTFSSRGTELRQRPIEPGDKRVPP